MPSLYAHNLYGRLVARQTTPFLRQLLRQHYRAFAIGCQGPDILFFHQPLKGSAVSALGNTIHNAPASDFIGKGASYLCQPADVLALQRMEQKNASWSKANAYAYLLGFLCHYALDSTCHPYINRVVETIPFDHVEMETEFERYLLLKNGEDPLSYPLYRLIPRDAATIQAILPFYTPYGVSYEDIKLCLNHFVQVKKVLYAPSTVKQESLLGAARLLGKYAFIQGHVMRSTPNPKSQETNPQIMHLFQAAISLGTQLLSDFQHQMINGQAPGQTDPIVLGVAYQRNFE